MIMTVRRRGVALTPMETRHDVIVQAAQLADELGYEAFSVPEGWGLDSTVVLAELALRTRQITLVSGVLSVWGRTAATLAMTAATLHQLTEGRYVLGLGASTSALVEGFHDLPFTRPATRLRQVTGKVRALLDGEHAQLDIAGTTGARPLRLGQPPVPGLPIWLAALGERTARVAAELGDGWFPVFVARDGLAARVANLKGVRQDAALRTGPLTVAAGPFTVADADAGAARGFAASCAAWYLCAMGDVYRRSVRAQGYAPAVRAVLAANPRPRLHGGVVPPEAQALLDQFTAHGTAGQVGDQLEGWAGVADITMIGLPPGLPWETIEATLRAAAP
jgi:alkanesulfonate monooxygenase SsuD/methylene tetrahydromethanopterin reductase-like flavin-dependent oxidoreductase (luciferase family)